MYSAFEQAESLADFDTIVLDGLNYLMDMFESVHVLTAANTMKAWSDYSQYFKNLMQQYVASSTKNVVMTAHTRTVYNEAAAAMETKVPIKGALANQGIESYFSCVVSTKKMKLSSLEGYTNDLLHISQRDMNVGYKHVFQTNITKETIQERMRSPMGLFTDEETFIDNDISLVLNRLHEYYS